jgi:hypothetical protein
VSFYGVIIDAGHPYKGQNRFICTIKVVDQTRHATTEEQVKTGFALITCFAKRMEDLPVVRKIGDVIRCQRALGKDARGTRQYSVNMAFNSSWCLFHSSDILLRDVRKGAANQDVDPGYSSSDAESDQEMETEMPDGTTGSDKMVEKSERRKYTPYKFSGKSYSFDYSQEKVIVENLREW